MGFGYVLSKLKHYAGACGPGILPYTFLWLGYFHNG